MVRRISSRVNQPRQNVSIGATMAHMLVRVAALYVQVPAMKHFEKLHYIYLQYLGHLLSIEIPCTVNDHKIIIINNLFKAANLGFALFSTDNRFMSITLLLQNLP